MSGLFSFNHASNPSLSSNAAHGLQYQPSTRQARKQKKAAAKFKKNQVGHFAAPGGHLKDVFPGSIFSSKTSERSNACRRMQYHLDKFVHKDLILKAAATFGLGATTVTIIMIATGVLKAGAFGALLASPVGHAALIGVAAGFGLFLVGYIGLKLYRKMKQNAADRIEEVNEKRLQGIEGHFQAKSNVPAYGSTQTEPSSTKVTFANNNKNASSADNSKQQNFQGAGGESTSAWQ